jgi:hypothetical protein
MDEADIFSFPAKLGSGGRHGQLASSPPPSEHLGLFRREQKLFPPRKNPTGST